MCTKPIQSHLPAPTTFWKATTPEGAKKPSCCKRILSIVWAIISLIIFPILIIRIILFLVRRALTYVMMPQLRYNDHTPKRLNEIHAAYKEAYRIGIETSDGCKLDGIVFPGKYKDKVIVYSLGRRSSWENSTLSYMPWLAKTGATVVMVNPRGVEKSTGFPDPAGFGKDLQAVYGYIINQMNINIENILCYGYSLGGVTACLGLEQVQKDYPDTTLKLVVERSFAHTTGQIKQLIGSGMAGKIVAGGVNKLGLGLDSASAFKGLKVEKGVLSQAIIFHNEDEAVGTDASIHTALKDTTNVRFIEMKEKEKAPSDETSRKPVKKAPYHNHCRPYTAEEEAKVVATMQQMLGISNSSSESEAFTPPNSAAAA